MLLDALLQGVFGKQILLSVYIPVRKAIEG